MNITKCLFKYVFTLSILCIASVSHASVSVGSIDNVNNTALLCTNDTCTTSTRINFKTTLGNPIQITDTILSGNAWSETFGWINFAPNYSGVTNTSSGVLGGYAWGDSSGWINFAPTNGGVTINNSGQFVGFAWSENYGWIKFDCNVANACVSTDWRPLGVRPNPSYSSGSIPFWPQLAIVPIIPTQVPVPVYVETPPIKDYSIVQKPKTITTDSPKEEEFFTNPQPEQPINIYKPKEETTKKTNIDTGDDEENLLKSKSFIDHLQDLFDEFMNTVKSSSLSVSTGSVDLNFRFKDYQIYLTLPTIFILIVLVAIIFIIFFLRRRRARNEVVKTDYVNINPDIEHKDGI